MEMHDNIINVALYIMRVKLSVFKLQPIRLKTDYVPNVDSSRLVNAIFVN